MRYILLIFAFVLVIRSAKSQDAIADIPKNSEINIVQDSKNGEFSKFILEKLEQFNSLYTTKIELGAPYFITSTEIRKADLFYSVQKLFDYYQKVLKKGTIPKENIENELSSILDKCLKVYNSNTNQIESELKSTNNPKEIVAIFNEFSVK